MRKLREIGGYVLVKLENTEAEEYGYCFGVIRMDQYTGDIDQDHGYMEYDGMDSFDEAMEKLVGLLEDDAGENQGYRIGCLKGLERESLIKMIDAMIKGFVPPPKHMRLIYTSGERETLPNPDHEQCHSRMYRRPHSMRPCSDYLSRRPFTHTNQVAQAVYQKDVMPVQTQRRRTREGYALAADKLAPSDEYLVKEREAGAIHKDIMTARGIIREGLMRYTKKMLHASSKKQAEDLSVFNALRDFSSERDIQDAYDWGLFSEAKYERLLDLWRAREKYIDKQRKFIDRVTQILEQAANSCGEEFYKSSKNSMK